MRILRENSFVLKHRRLELDYLAEALVDLTPVLAEIDGTEAKDVVAECVVLIGDINIGLGIDHDALCLQGVWDGWVFLILDVTLNLADVVGAKVLAYAEAGDKHLLVVLGVKDDALAFFRVVKGDIGLHYRQQFHIFCVDGVKVEGDSGATYNRIFFAAFHSFSNSNGVNTSWGSLCVCYSFILIIAR